MKTYFKMHNQFFQIGNALVNRMVPVTELKFEIEYDDSEKKEIHQAKIDLSLKEFIKNNPDYCQASHLTFTNDTGYYSHDSSEQVGFDQDDDAFCDELASVFSRIDVKQFPNLISVDLSVICHHKDHIINFLKILSQVKTLSTLKVFFNNRNVLPILEEFKNISSLNNLKLTVIPIIFMHEYKIGMNILDFFDLHLPHLDMMWDLSNEDMDTTTVKMLLDDKCRSFMYKEALIALRDEGNKERLCRALDFAEIAARKGHPRGELLVASILEMKGKFLESAEKYLSVINNDKAYPLVKKEANFALARYIFTGNIHFIDSQTGITLTISEKPNDKITRAIQAFPFIEEVDGIGRDADLLKKDIYNILQHPNEKDDMNRICDLNSSETITLEVHPDIKHRFDEFQIKFYRNVEPLLTKIAILNKELAEANQRIQYVEKLLTVEKEISTPDWQVKPHQKITNFFKSNKRQKEEDNYAHERKVAKLI